MSSSFVTQCPHCRTRFRVNHAQLGAANGAVRCGACMHVFDAARHLLADQPVARTQQPGEPAVKPPSVDMPPASAVVPAAVSGTPAGKTPGDTLWIHDDLDIDDLDLDEELARLEREELSFSQDFMALEKAPKPAQALLTAAPATRDPHDERWAEALLNENSSAAAELQPDAPSLGDGSTAAASEPDELDQPQWPALERLDPAIDSAIDPDSDAELSATPTEHSAAASTDHPTRRRAAPVAGQRDAYELLDEPVRLDWRAPAKPRGRWLFWGLLNLLALVLLAGQYVLHNFADLARQDQYRPWFNDICPALGCQVPSRVDVGQIKSSNLMVRAHPQFAGALIVDAIIYNRAPFAQPFPLLEMRFADLQGEPIASRRFKPAEYLAGELAGQTEMPSQTPIRIALEILDPGRGAENYSLQFLSPE